MNHMKYWFAACAIIIVVLLSIGILSSLDDDAILPNGSACSVSNSAVEQGPVGKHKSNSASSETGEKNNQHNAESGHTGESGHTDIDDTPLVEPGTEHTNSGNTPIDQNALVHELTGWDDSIRPITIPKSKSDEGNKGVFGFTPVFVDAESLVNFKNIGHSKYRRWDGSPHLEQPDFDLEYDGSLLVKVIASEIIEKIQVVNIRSGEAWAHEWQYKIYKSRSMFVPFEFADVLLVRTHLVGCNRPTEHYYSSMCLTVEPHRNLFDRVNLLCRTPSNEGGSFTVESEDGSPVAGAVLLDSWRQVLGRTDSTGTLHWNKLVDEKPIVSYPVVLWKPGHIPVVFGECHPINKTLPTSGVVKIGQRSVFVTAYLPGEAQLAHHERCGTTGGVHSYPADLLPLPDDVEITDFSQVPPVLGYRNVEDHPNAQCLLFPEWGGHWSARDENSNPPKLIEVELDIQGFPEDSYITLQHWFFQHWVLDRSGYLTVELPVAGKYLLKIGSYHSVLRKGDPAYDEDELDTSYGEGSHFVFIDARDPKKPILKLFARPK